MKTLKTGLLCLFATFVTINLNAKEPITVDSIHPLDEVVVAASRQGLRLRAIPSSVSVITKNNISELNINSVPDITSIIPNLIIHNYGSKLTSPVYIRGIGSKLGNPSVVMYVDNVPYYAKALINTELNDIKSIEVLRGPQGTEYGRNTMGGVINITTLDPMTYQGVKLKLQGATYNEGLASLGIYKKWNNWASSINGYYLHRDGFFMNKFTNKKSDNIDAWGLRHKLTNQASENLTFTNVFSLSDSKQGSSPYAVYDSKTKSVSDINYNDPSKYDNLTLNDAFIATFNKDNYNLRSVTTYQYYKDKHLIDQDFTPKTLVAAMQDTKQHDITQDLNLRIRYNDDVSLLFGFFGFYQQSYKDILADVKFRKMKSYKDYKNVNYGSSIFHSTKIDNILFSGLSLTAGVRFDIETAMLNYISSVNKPIDENTPVKKLHSPLFMELMPKVALGYQTANHNAYFTISRGYQTGGFNASFDNVDNITYNPEYSWNYEIGLKSNWFGNMLHTDLSLFYIDWKDQQVYKMLPIGSMTINAGHTYSRGAELSINLAPIGGFSFIGSYGYTDARFINNNTSAKANYDGKRIPYVPQHTASLMLKQSIDLNWWIFNNIDFIATGKGMGKIYFDEANTMSQDFYNTIDASISCRILNNYKLTIWGQNLGNTKYTAYQFRFMKSQLAQLGRPRQIGMTLDVEL